MKDEKNFSIENSIYFLKHQQAIEKVVILHLSGLIPAIPDWVIKQTLGFDLWHDSIHTNDMRHRLKELRVFRPEKELHPDVELFTKLLRSAPTAQSMLVGIYHAIKSNQIRYYELHKKRTLPVNDAPTIRLIEQILSDKKDQISTIDSCIRQSLDWQFSDQEKSWQAVFARSIEALFSNLFAGTAHTIDMESVVNQGTSLPILPSKKAFRPKRFKINNNPKLPENLTPEQETIFHFSNFVQEMQAAETVGSILYETSDMPWEYVYDISRHLWDEIRHSMMGEIRLKELGIALEEIEFATANYEWRQTIDPTRRFATLTYVIESGAFPLKHHRLKKHLDAQDFLSAQTYLYDITDETSHVQNGKKWVPQMMNQYQIDMDIDEFIEECRSVNNKYTQSPMQKSDVMKKLILNS